MTTKTTPIFTLTSGTRLTQSAKLEFPSLNQYIEGSLIFGENSKLIGGNGNLYKQFTIDGNTSYYSIGDYNISSMDDSPVIKLDPDMKYRIQCSVRGNKPEDLNLFTENLKQFIDETISHLGQINIGSEEII